MQPKNNILTLTFILLSLLRVASQDQKWEAGLVAGKGIVYLRNPKLSYRDDFSGFGVGLSLKYTVAKRFFIMANVIYEPKKLKFHGSFTDSQGNPLGRIDSKFTLHYISLPFIAGWSFGKKTKLILNTGAYINFLAKEFYETDVTYTSGNNNQHIKFEGSSTRKIDAGLIAGFGVSHPISSLVTLSLELRNYVGLVGIGKQQASSNSYMNYQTLLLGINYKLGRAK